MRARARARTSARLFQIFSRSETQRKSLRAQMSKMGNALNYKKNLNKEVDYSG